MVFGEERGRGLRKRLTDVDLFAVASFAADCLKCAKQVGRVNELTETCMDGTDVIVLQVDFEEDLPVEVVLLLIDAFKNVV